MESPLKRVQSFVETNQIWILLTFLMVGFLWMRYEIRSIKKDIKVAKEDIVRSIKKEVQESAEDIIKVLLNSIRHDLIKSIIDNPHGERREIHGQEPRSDDTDQLIKSLTHLWDDGSLNIKAATLGKIDSAKQTTGSNAASLGKMDFAQQTMGSNAATSPGKLDAAQQTTGSNAASPGKLDSASQPVDSEGVSGENKKSVQ